MKTETDFPPANEAHIRATAWALGQLTTEETAAFETEIAVDPALAAYAREMESFCSILGGELQPHPEESSLPGPRRASIVTALSAVPAQAKPRPFLQRHWQGIGLTAAAAAAITLMLKPQWQTPAPILTTPRIAAATPATSATSATSAANPAAIVIRPTMPGPLFVGTPIPQTDAPPNLDLSKTPTLEVTVPAGTVLISPRQARHQQRHRPHRRTLPHHRWR